MSPSRHFGASLYPVGPPSTGQVDPPRQFWYLNLNICGVLSAVCSATAMYVYTFLILAIQ
jgi:hypothetical protein